jgi:hypothetical protein
MKNSFKLLLTLFMLALLVNVSNGQNPTYNLTAKNCALITVNQPDDALEFDCYLEVTGNGPMEYAGGQYFFSFNNAVLGGNNANGAYTIVGSDLTATMQPRNPSIGTATSPTANVLRLAVNTFPGAGNGTIMNVGFPGTKIVRMRLRNTTGTFPIADLQLAWRNPPVVAFSTKIFAYIGTTNTDITTPQTHTVETGFCNGTPLPVELASFTSSVNRNNVTLNWSTTRETNNSGFDIERKLSTATDWTRVSNVAGNGNSTVAHNYTYTERANTGKYDYRLKQIDFNGNFSYFNLSNEVEVGVPSKYDMSQNYPNPFNPTTKVDYDLPYDGKVSILLYDISGREVANLVNEVKTAGYYTVQFNASDLASGMYFYRITATNNNNQNFVTTKKMVLIK